MRTLILSLLLACSVCLVSCGTPPVRTPAEIEANNHLEAAVRAELNKAPYIYTSHINIKADGGVVTLSDMVTDEYEMNETLRITRKVPGVTKVINELIIDRDGRGKQ
ncbi:MAG: BON domain-containing protein [Betaproteobacteria bacterium]|nr:BON domain-containing protein [Betaproteobacteria bacterium]